MKEAFEAEIVFGAEVFRPCKALMEGVSSFIVEGFIPLTICSMSEEALLY